MTQNDYLSQLLGKRITGIVMKESDGTPKSQLFLLFEDDTHFEFYSVFDRIVPTKGLWQHGEGHSIQNVRAYMGETMHIAREVYLEGSAQEIPKPG
jgi:hypothetical protein